MPVETGAPLPDAVHAGLRAEILASADAPGTLVTESAVALRYGVARPTAKLAIERLVAEGLLHREANRAARVPELTRADVVDLYTTRALLESAAAESLARDGAAPAAAVAAHRELLALHEGDPFAEADIAFHRALVAGQRSPRLARLHALLMGEIELCIAQVQAGRLMTAAQVGAEHQAILDAVTAGDAASAGRLARSHVEGSRDRLLLHSDAPREARTPERLL